MNLTKRRVERNCGFESLMSMSGFARVKRNPEQVFAISERAYEGEPSELP